MAEQKTGVVLKVDQGKPFEGAHGTLYGWWVSLSNGDNISVNTQSPDKAPWPVGAEATYEITKTHQGRNGPWHTAKKIVPKENFARPAAGQPAKQATGWTPEKENSVMIQGLLKSIIESSTPQAEWEPKLLAALALHDATVAKRTVTAAAYPAAPKPALAGAFQEEEGDSIPF
jgi:hypothetical protein